MSKRKYSIVTYLAIWSIFAMAQCVGSIDPMLDAIAEHFKISNTTALYCSTLASIVAGFSGMAVGFAAGRKIRYKTVGVVGGIFLVIGGIVPYFASSFAELLVLRAVFGVGMGALMCMQNPVTTALIPIEQRAKILGTGMFCGFAMQCILQYFGGVLIDHFGWNCGFLIHILLVLPLIMIIFFLPDTGMEVKEKAAVQESETVQNGLPLKAIALCVMWGISFMMIVPLLIGCAFLSNQIVQSAMWAGVVAVCFSFGCMTGGLVFDKIYGIFKRRVMTVCLLVMAAGLLGSAAVRSILLLCIFNYIAGIGMSSLQASMMMVLGMICHPSKVGLASSIMVSLQNILTFFCSMYEELVGMISGDSLYMPLYVGCTAYIIFAAVLFIKPPFPTESGH